MNGDEETAVPVGPDGRDAAFTASATDRDRTLEAVHGLEDAVARAGPGREPDWLALVHERLTLLEEAIGQERRESLRPDSLLSMIGRDYARRFGSRVRQLREQQDDLLTQVASLRGQLHRQPTDEAVDIPDLRQRLGWVVQAVKHRRTREADLVYEALTLDLGNKD